MAVFRGNAALQWVDGQTSERLLLLREPMRELRAGHKRTFYVADSMDYTQRQTFAIAGGAFELTAVVRWGDNPQGFIDLINSGAAQQVITYFPNLNDPGTSYACYLISPSDPHVLQMDPATGTIFGDQMVELVFRKTDGTPFQAAWHDAELFRFRAGDRIAESTFTRASVGTYLTQGYPALGSAAAGIARIQWHDLNGDGIAETPALLLEPPVTNLIENSDCEADVVGWAGVAGGAVSQDTAHAFSGTHACKIIVANANISGAVLTKRSGGRFTGSAGTGYAFSYWIYATGTAIGKSMYAYINWWSVAPAIISSTTATATLVAGWQRVFVTGVAPAGTVTIDPEIITHGAQGIFTVWADVPQLEVLLAGQTVPTSAIATSTGTVTRSGDALSFALPALPQSVTLYVRFVELGTIGLTNPRLLSLGTGAPWLFLDSNGTDYFLGYTPVASENDSTLAAAPTVGQVVELMGTLSSSGVAQISQSINGGAVTSGSATTAATLPQTWNAPTLVVGSGGAIVAYTHIFILRGVQTLDAMRKYAGVS